MFFEFGKEGGFRGETGHFTKAFEVILGQDFFIIKTIDYIINAVAVDEMVEVFFEMEIEQLRQLVRADLELLGEVGEA